MLRKCHRPICNVQCPTTSAFFFTLFFSMANDLIMHLRKKILTIPRKCSYFCRNVHGYSSQYRSKGKSPNVLEPRKQLSHINVNKMTKWTWNNIKANIPPETDSRNNVAQVILCEYPFILVTNAWLANIMKLEREHTK